MPRGHFWSLCMPREGAGQRGRRCSVVAAQSQGPRDSGLLCLQCRHQGHLSAGHLPSATGTVSCLPKDRTGQDSVLSRPQLGHSPPGTYRPACQAPQVSTRSLRPQATSSAAAGSDATVRRRLRQRAVLLYFQYIAHEVAQDLSVRPDVPDHLPSFLVVQPLIEHVQIAA
jgi:hypothetical protein